MNESVAPTTPSRASGGEAGMTIPTRSATRIDWLLVDYGETLSTPLPASTIDQLADLAGQDPARFLQRYWQARPDYDLGQPPETYWARVLRRDPSDLGSLTDALTRIDVEGWLVLLP